MGPAAPHCSIWALILLRGLATITAAVWWIGVYEYIGGGWQPAGRSEGGRGTAEEGRGQPGGQPEGRPEGWPGRPGGDYKTTARQPTRQLQDNLQDNYKTTY